MGFGNWPCFLETWPLSHPKRQGLLVPPVRKPGISGTRLNNTACLVFLRKMWCIASTVERFEATNKGENPMEQLTTWSHVISAMRRQEWDVEVYPQWVDVVTTHGRQGGFERTDKGLRAACQFYRQQSNPVQQR